LALSGLAAACGARKDNAAHHFVLLSVCQVTYTLVFHLCQILSKPPVPSLPRSTAAYCFHLSLKWHGKMNKTVLQNKGTALFNVLFL
jgi:hypothetical protein